MITLRLMVGISGACLMSAGLALARLPGSLTGPECILMIGCMLLGVASVLGAIALGD